MPSLSRSGAPLELAPLEDTPSLGANARRNNDFGYADDPFQRACPYAAHIRKANPPDDPPGRRADTLTHRIIRAGIPFGPEMAAGETHTMHSRGLMFVCYQVTGAPLVADEIGVVGVASLDELELALGSPVVPGFDPIIGQAPGARVMDEPVPNYPSGNRRSVLDMPEQFVILTAGGYFFMPSLGALRNMLT